MIQIKELAVRCGLRLEDLQEMLAVFYTNA